MLGSLNIGKTVVFRRKNNFLRLVLALCVAGGAILGSGCGVRRDTTEVVFWALGAEGERVAAMMPEFERRYPEIKVRVQMIPWNAAHEKLLTAFAGQSLPDMCQLGNTWIPEFTVLNAIEDLGPWVASSQTVHDSSYFPGIWDTNTMDSVLYGIPWYVDTRVLFYRADLCAKAGYAKAPQSWDEWFDLCAKLKAKFPENYGIFFSTNNEWVGPVILGVQKHSSLLKDHNTLGNFSGPEFTEATRAFHKFFKNGWAPVKTTQIVNVYQSFAEGDFAMYITGPWNIGEFGRRLPRELQGAWMTAPLPGPDGGIGLSLAGGSSFVMFKSSKHKDAVWKLIEFLSEPPQQLELYRLTGDLPARVEAWSDPALANNKYAAAFFTQLNHVVATPKIPEWEQIAQKVREYAELISMDQYTVEDGLAALDREINVILEKRRWLVHGK
jgi:multiple sugar transport system substrate-binding protein